MHGEEVAYFRKVNFLHKWVEDHLNEGRETNCEPIPFHLEAMAGLVQTCAHGDRQPEPRAGVAAHDGQVLLRQRGVRRVLPRDVGDVLSALARILAYERDA